VFKITCSQQIEGVHDPVTPVPGPVHAGQERAVKQTLVMDYNRTWRALPMDAARLRNWKPEKATAFGDRSTEPNRPHHELQQMVYTCLEV
jgi:hypothetical protein